MERSKTYYRDCALSLVDALNINDVEQSINSYFRSEENDNLYVLCDAFAELYILPKIKKNVHFEKVQTPSLVVTRDDHPLVALSKEDDVLYVYDPALGKVVEHKYSSLRSVIVEFEYLEGDERELSISTKNWFFKLLKRFKGMFMQVVFISTILNFLALLTPVFIFAIFSQINNNEASVDMSLMAVGVAVFILMQFVFNVAKGYLLSFIGGRLGYLICTEYFRRILLLKVTHLSQAKVSKLLPKFDEFLFLSGQIGGEVSEKLFDFFYLILMIIFIFYIGGSTGLVPFVTVLIFFLISLFYVPFHKKVTESTKVGGGNLNDFLVESVMYEHTITHVLGVDNWLKIGLKMVLGKVQSAEKRALFSSSASIISDLLIQISVVITIYVGVQNVLGNEMSPAALMVCVFLLWKALGPLKNITNVVVRLKRITGIIKGIEDFMLFPVEETSLKIHGPPLRIDSIVFDNVTAKYKNSSHFVLRGVSLKFEGNGIYFIYGKDGSGRSSMVQIISGLLEHSMGKVLINGMNHSQYNQIELRRAMSIAPSDDTFFHLSLYENFLNYNKELTREKVLEILADFEVSLKDEDLDKTHQDLTQVLSACEIRRIVIARSFSKDCSVYIFNRMDRGLSRKGTEIVLRHLNRMKNEKMILITGSNHFFANHSSLVLWLEGGKVKLFDKQAKFFSELGRKS